MVLDQLAATESLQNIIYALRCLMILDVVKLALEHAPSILDSLSAHERILFVHIMVRMVNPEMIPAKLI